MALDERLRGELDRAAQPADPSGIYEHLIRRRERHRIAQRVQGGLLAAVVLMGSVGGFYVLTRIFRETEKPPPVASPTMSNGVIVFSLPLEDGGEHVFAVGADGSGLRQLTPEGSAVYRSPDVSPDGRTVLVVHQIPSFEPWQSVLAVVPIEGGSPTWVTDEPWLVLDPTWSPDGEQIAFVGSPGGPYGIYVLDVASGDVELIPDTDAVGVGHPTWSPDGSRIAFGASVNSADIPDERWDIFSVHLDGTGLINLTNTPDQRETWPTWSWSTDRIAFVQGGPAEGALLTMAPDGTDAVLVTDELQDLASPAWSPDGTMLTFSADTGQVYTVGLDGRDPRAVTGALGEPAWQAIPDDGLPAPTPTPTPTAEPQPEGEDIGLGFPVCNLTSVRGVFATGITGTAYVATKMGDTGGCSRSGVGFQVLAVDVSGDGLADTSYGPLSCEQWCSVFAAPDVDGDGTDELLIQNVEFSIVGLKLFEVVSSESEPAVSPVIVEPPGDAPFGFQGFEGGEEPQFWIGGDAFIGDAIRCEATDQGRVLISMTGESRPHDSPDAMWYATETTFVLEGGSLRVLDVRETIDDPLAFVTTGCGADLNLFD